MNGKYILDTNIIIGLFANDPIIIKNAEHANQLYTTSIVIGELFYGAYNSKHKKANIQKIQELCSNIEVLLCDVNTSKIYGEIKYQIKIKGKPILENDIWIAALSIQHKIPLISKDNHFRQIDGLTLQDWK